MSTITVSVEIDGDRHGARVVVDSDTDVHAVARDLAERVYRHVSIQLQPHLTREDA